jgi:cytochrome c
MFNWAERRVSASRARARARAAMAVAGMLIATGCLAASPAHERDKPVSASVKPAGYYGYGTSATPQQIAGWNIDVRPDGKGLPPGSGSVEKGADIFQTHCAACHGAFGEGMGRYPKLSGGIGSLKADHPEKTVGSYWPYATTLWDYIHRAMPFYAPQSLTDDQVYALTAYVLNLSNVVPPDFVASQKNLASVKMPNRNGFVRPDPRPDTHDTACMKDCKSAADVKIVSTAAGRNLTPRTTGPLDEQQP